ncbi:hypothetical protein F5Y05DRAFT_425021 [Hypoxylon sp. FL0543]|nr:hypothetical protein F5Y05DRAFT_425021 [Hypoxylon sp. FL0543]
MAALVDHPWARGHIAANGTFVCDVPGCPQPRDIANTRASISSHITKIHTTGSQHEIKSMVDPRRCGLCNRSTSSTFHALVRHVRETHGYRGESESLWLQYGNTNVGDQIQIPLSRCTGRITRPRRRQASRPASRPARGPAARPARGPAARPARGPAARPARGPAARPARGRASRPASRSASLSASRAARGPVRRSARLQSREQDAREA